MLRLKKLDIFIAKQFGLLFVATFFICQFVLMMQFMWRYIDDLIGKGLSMEVMAQFFWWMGLMLVPQALPLAILLSSLITYGNLGESSELTAIKAAGISLMQSFRSLIVLSVIISIASFFFQNNIGPQADMKIARLILSMRQKSPELQIPEGIFYDGIPSCNLYVQKKDLNTGKLYGIMIYRMTGSYEDQAIILADSGMLQSTADKQHLVLSLWSGEWFENMQAQELANSASVPYRRETFISKKIVIDFNDDFKMTDAAMVAGNAKGKSLAQISHDVDSISHVYDSIGGIYRADLNRQMEIYPGISKKDSLAAVKRAAAASMHPDSLFERLSDNQKLAIVNRASMRVQTISDDLQFKALVAEEADKLLRSHEIERINKFTLALTCLIFFFIGAPLGAIIRKGGLGFPVLISVMVFIVFYILDNTGYRMARLGEWSIFFGKALAPGVLIPIAVFVTYKANNDSVVFNMDLYRTFFMKLLGLRLKRHINGKEVIIEDPHYEDDAVRLARISEEVTAYSHAHRLISAPNIIKVFFRYEPDNEVERIVDELEEIINDLGNTRDKVVLTEINHYPVVSAKAHTRPFERKWLNIMAAVFVPLGAVLYVRMWMFRLRLLHDLRVIKHTNEKIIARIDEMKELKD